MKALRYYMALRYVLQCRASLAAQHTTCVVRPRQVREPQTLALMENRECSSGLIAIVAGAAKELARNYYYALGERVRVYCARHNGKVATTTTRMILYFATKS